MRRSRATRRGDSISSGVIVTAGVLCGIFVFFVALPLAQSSPFPMPTSRDWVDRRASAAPASFQLASAAPASFQLASAVSMPVVVGVRGDREVLRRAKAAPKVMVASLGNAPIELPTQDAAAQEPDPEVTGSIPPTPPARPASKVLAPIAALPKVVLPRPAPKPRDVMEAVDRYLWQVYEREPEKRDSTGDFTWKDKTAAKRIGKSLKDYAIGGMDRDFREALYHAGRAMDAAGLHWSMLSAFRDDYRQQIASGFKARTGNSLHGGSRATGGYGHGRAVDVTSVGGENDEAIWHWFDKNGAKYGLIRPMPGADPAHIQSRGNWHEVAVALRRARTGTTDVAAAPAKKAKVADERHRHHRRGGRG